VSPTATSDTSTPSGRDAALGECRHDASRPAPDVEDGTLATRDGKEIGLVDGGRPAFEVDMHRPGAGAAGADRDPDVEPVEECVEQVVRGVHDDTSVR